MPQLSFHPPRRLAVLLLAAGSFLVTGLTACTLSGPGGPLFVAATQPGPGDTLVYLYRKDPLRGVPAVDIKLDAQDMGELRSGEYLSFLVDPGRHALAARLRWMGVIPRSWNRIEFTAKPGQTVYLAVWAGYNPAHRPAEELRATSGAEPTTEVAVYLAQRSIDDAGRDLPEMRRTSGR